MNDQVAIAKGDDVGGGQLGEHGSHRVSRKTGYLGQLLPADRQLHALFGGLRGTSKTIERDEQPQAQVRGGKAPGEDGLFDLMDLFNTSLALAGIEDKIPTERYIDGVDQTSFLLADDGETNRQAVFSYNQADFSALRWGEFKAYFTVQLTDQPFTNISMSTYVPVGVSPWVFDLYRDPKERLTRSNGDYEWIYGPIVQMQAAHAATFAKYPKKDIGLGVGASPDAN